MVARLDLLARELVTGGLRGGLVWLNRRVPHRFTAAYLLRNQMLHLVALVDKRDEPAMRERLGAVPLADSFCVLTLRDGVFVTSEASQDPRLDGHPAQAIMRSYVGLPVHRGPGELIGTFCHFDFTPHTLEDAEFAFLEDAVTFLSPYVERALDANLWQRPGRASPQRQLFRPQNR